MAAAAQTKTKTKLEAPEYGAYCHVAEKLTTAKQSSLNTVERLATAAAFLRLTNPIVGQFKTSEALQVVPRDYTDLSTSHVNLPTVLEELLTKLKETIAILRSVPEDDQTLFREKPESPTTRLSDFCKTKADELEREVRLFEALQKISDHETTHRHAFVASWNEAQQVRTRDLPSIVFPDHVAEAVIYNSLVKELKENHEAALKLIANMARATSVMTLYFHIMGAPNVSAEERKQVSFYLDTYAQLPTDYQEFVSDTSKHAILHHRLIRMISDFNQVSPKDKQVSAYCQAALPHLRDLELLQGALKHRMKCLMEIHHPNFPSSYENLKNAHAALMKGPESTQPGIFSRLATTYRSTVPTYLGGTSGASESSQPDIVARMRSLSLDPSLTEMIEAIKGLSKNLQAHRMVSDPKLRKAVNTLVKEMKELFFQEHTEVGTPAENTSCKHLIDYIKEMMRLLELQQEKIGLFVHVYGAPSTSVPLLVEKLTALHQLFFRKET